MTPAAFAEELEITVGYVYNLRAGRVSPGAKLRLKIHQRTDGAVPFDSWG